MFRPAISNAGHLISFPLPFKLMAQSHQRPAASPRTCPFDVACHQPASATLLRKSFFRASQPVTCRKIVAIFTERFKSVDSSTEHSKRRRKVEPLTWFLYKPRNNVTKQRVYYVISPGRGVLFPFTNLAVSC